MHLCQIVVVVVRQKAPVCAHCECMRHRFREKVSEQVYLSHSWDWVENSIAMSAHLVQ